jgi:hypothetical protein
MKANLIQQAYNLLREMEGKKCNQFLFQPLNLIMLYIYLYNYIFKDLVLCHHVIIQFYIYQQQGLEGIRNKTVWKLQNE